MAWPAPKMRCNLLTFVHIARCRDVQRAAVRGSTSTRWLSQGSAWVQAQLYSIMHEQYWHAAPHALPTFHRVGCCDHCFHFQNQQPPSHSDSAVMNSAVHVHIGIMLQMRTCDQKPSENGLQPVLLQRASCLQEGPGWSRQQSSWRLCVDLPYEMWSRGKNRSRSPTVSKPAAIKSLHTISMTSCQRRCLLIASLYQSLQTITRPRMSHAVLAHRSTQTRSQQRHGGP